MNWPLLAIAFLQAPAAPAATPLPPNLASLGPKVGEPLPAFSLQDQQGRTRDFASLSGPQGLVLVFFRSADW